MNAHFEFWRLGQDGLPMGTPVKVNTETGLILQCHPNCAVDQIRYLAEMARQTPDYPIDLSAWGGTAKNRYMFWSARIFYRRENYV